MAETINLLKAAVLGDGYSAELLDYIDRIDVRPPAAYLKALDQFIRAGQRHEWWDRVGDICILGTGVLQSSLTGLKGFFDYADMTVVGTVTAEYRLGITASTGAYVNTGTLAGNLPGVDLNTNSLAVGVTSDLPGPWQEAGATGTAGLQSFSIRSSGAFRSGFWSCASQIQFGGANCPGLTMGVRTNSDGGFSVRETTVASWANPAVSLPNANFTICKSHPASSSSPNRILMVMVGGGDWTEAEAVAFSEDFTQLVAALGQLDLISVEPQVFGPSCYGKNALSFLPSDVRFIQSAPPPLNDSIDYAQYANFPVTGCFTRPYTVANNTNEALNADPIETVNGEEYVIVEHEDHGLLAGDTAELKGVAAGNGFTSAQLNREQIITAIDDVDHYRVVPAAGTAASASGSIGGASCQVSNRSVRAQPSTWTKPYSDDGLWIFGWSNRGEREEEGGDIVTYTRKPNDLNPGLTRRVAPFANVQCRPAYTTHDLAIGATLVYYAHILGYDERDEADDPLGQGWRDIADAWGYDGDVDILTWQEAVDSKETLFTTSLEGFAASYDKIILSPLTIGAVPNIVGIALDNEHVDNRTGEKQLAFITRLGQIADAKGKKVMILSHSVHTTQGSRNGWTSGTTGSAYLAMQDPNIHLIGINVDQITDPPGAVDYCEAQISFLGGGVGDPPLEKMLLQFGLGTGPNTVSLEKCQEIADWWYPRGIRWTGIRRLAMSQGGNEWRFAQQQTSIYSGLSTRLLTATQIANEYDRNVVIDAGRKSLLITLIQNLMDDGIWFDLDALWLYAAENEAQALRDIKSGIVSVPIDTPTFTVDRGYTFNGTSQYIATGFTPSANGVHMKVPTYVTSHSQNESGEQVAVWERGTVASDGYAAGAFQTTLRNLQLRPRSAGGSLGGRANSPLLETVMASSDGFSSVMRIRNSDRLAITWKNGVQQGTGSPQSASTSDATSREIYVGALNNDGTASDFRASQISAVVLAPPMVLGSGGQKHTALYNRIREHLVAVGAV
jgi:hypothetical protein